MKTDAEYQRKYRAMNRDRFRAYEEVRYAKHGEKRREASKRYGKVRYWANREEIRKRRKQLDYAGRRRREDIGFRILGNLRCRIRDTVRGQKSARTVLLLGCSIPSFLLYIESKFEPGMTWQNYGKLWEIDHIMPCAIFDLSKSEHQKRCFHFSNMQPLTVTDNRKKHTRYEQLGV
jgi:hypothetical protein